MDATLARDAQDEASFSWVESPVDGGVNMYRRGGVFTGPRTLPLPGRPKRSRSR